MEIMGWHNSGCRVPRPCVSQLPNMDRGIMTRGAHQVLVAADAVGQEASNTGAQAIGSVQREPHRIVSQRQLTNCFLASAWQCAKASGL